MKRLLLARNLAVLEQATRRQLLLAFDFDGTLAPIVARRDDATMRRTTAELFRRVCSLYPTVVISGRGRDDVAARLGTAAVRAVVGNHGLEPGAGLAATERALREARATFGRLAAQIQGLELEDKRYSLAVHFRGVRHQRRARAAIHQAVATLKVPLRVVPGKRVLNLVLASAPNKGDAVVALREKVRAQLALYVGDDVTDEDVFRLDQPGRLLTVRVGPSRTSAASYFVNDQREVDQLLAHLVRFRARVR